MNASGKVDMEKPEITEGDILGYHTSNTRPAITSTRKYHDQRPDIGVVDYSYSEKLWMTTSSLMSTRKEPEYKKIELPNRNSTAGINSWFHNNETPDLEEYNSTTNYKDMESLKSDLQMRAEKSKMERREFLEKIGDEKFSSVYNKAREGFVGSKNEWIPGILWETLYCTKENKISGSKCKSGST